MIKSIGLIVVMILLVWGMHSCWTYATDEDREGVVDGIATVINDIDNFLDDVKDRVKEKEKNYE